MAQDSYVYLGHQRGAPWPRISDLQKWMTNEKCLDKLVREVKRAGNGSVNPNFTKFDCWSKVLTEMERFRANQTSIILSSEQWSNFNMPLWSKSARFPAFAKAVREALSADDWNVVVVMTYRRYAEWALSAIKQLRAWECLRPDRDWDRAIACKPTWHLVQEWMHREPPSAKNYHYTAHVKSQWEEYGFAVQLLNLHETESDMTEKLLCDILPNAPRTCDFVKSRTLPADSENVRSLSTGEYNNIVVEAARRGLIDDGTTTINRSRSQMVADLQSYHQQDLGLSFRDLPLLCPTQGQLEDLLTVSLSYEQRLMGAWYQSPNGEGEHRNSFWRVANDTKSFCSVNVDAILHQKTSWEQILQSLKIPKSPS